MTANLGRSSARAIDSEKHAKHASPFTNEITDCSILSDKEEGTRKKKRRIFIRIIIETTR